MELLGRLVGRIIARIWWPKRSNKQVESDGRFLALLSTFLVLSHWPTLRSNHRNQLFLPERHPNTVDIIPSVDYMKWSASSSAFYNNSTLRIIIRSGVNGCRSNLANILQVNNIITQNRAAWIPIRPPRVMGALFVAPASCSTYYFWSVTPGISVKVPSGDRIMGYTLVTRLGIVLEIPP